MVDPNFTRTAKEPADGFVSSVSIVSGYACFIVVTGQKI